MAAKLPEVESCSACIAQQARADRWQAPSEGLTWARGLEEGWGVAAKLPEVKSCSVCIAQQGSHMGEGVGGGLGVGGKAAGGRELQHMHSSGRQMATSRDRLPSSGKCRQAHSPGW